MYENQHAWQLDDTATTVTWESQEPLSEHQDTSDCSGASVSGTGQVQQEQQQQQKVADLLFWVLRRKYSTSRVNDELIRDKVARFLQDAERWENIEKAFSLFFQQRQVQRQASQLLLLPKDLLQEEEKEGNLSMMSSMKMMVVEDDDTTWAWAKVKSIPKKVPRKFKNGEGVMCGRCHQKKKNHICTKKGRFVAVVTPAVVSKHQQEQQDLTITTTTCTVIDENTPTSSGRSGGYNCGRCRKKKKGHTCEQQFQEDKKEEACSAME